MADGKGILSSLGKLLLVATGEADICETCCASSIEACNCSGSDADPRLKMTISWTEAAWQASTGYAQGIFITVTDTGTDYLFKKQNTGTQTSSSSAPSWDFTIGNDTTDGSITWRRIANNTERGYFGCSWENGQSMELCAFKANRGGSREYWKGPKSGIPTNAAWTFSLEGKHGFLQPHGTLEFSQVVWDHNIGQTGTMKKKARVRAKALYHPYRPVSYYGAGPFPASVTMLTSYAISNRTNMGSPKTSLELDVTAMSHIAKLTGTDTTAAESWAAGSRNVIPDGMFSQVTDNIGVTLKWERIAPADAVGAGSPAYWGATAP